MVLLNKNIQNLTNYPFDKLRALLGNTEIDTKITDMSIGQPMHAVPNFIKEIIYKGQDKWNSYPPLVGIPALQISYLRWLKSRFNVNSFFDEQNILPLSGTREGLFSVAMALNIQKICLPNPFYQVYLAASLFDNIKKSFLICNSDNNFLIDLNKLKLSLKNNRSLVYFCSPSNPQGKIASYDYLQELIKIVRFYDSVLIVDECYIDIFYEKLPIGTIEVCEKLGNSLNNVIIFHSLSKRSNVAGLRSGYLIGDTKIVQCFKKLRSYSAPTIPIPIQLASTELWKDEKHVIKNRELYKRKVKFSDKVFKSYRPYNSPEAGFFLWLKVKDSEEFTKKLYSKYDIKVMPGQYLAYGKKDNPGRQYVRIALVHHEKKNNAGLEKILKLLL
ncbi:MAG: aspartate aminotransferase [Pelagibacterales bacterium]|nr:aspartate aminotransferase [Pelagibacterales bacterium]OUU63181.1 MAG: hypothetical protein CBC22_01895 [Alphaproteobacteria bacterium TMED62]|tara:strand:- start:8269 stop:9429 length:1161 start_codon:yes stop_codon:yes gene_type:complete